MTEVKTTVGMANRPINEGDSPFKIVSRWRDYGAMACSYVAISN
jgi:hypothetical protein